jgi:hypothetical protein
LDAAGDPSLFVRSTTSALSMAGKVRHLFWPASVRGSNPALAPFWQGTRNFFEDTKGFPTEYAGSFPSIAGRKDGLWGLARKKSFRALGSIGSCPSRKNRFFKPFESALLGPCSCLTERRTKRFLLFLALRAGFPKAPCPATFLAPRPALGFSPTKGGMLASGFALGASWIFSAVTPLLSCTGLGPEL